MVYVIYFSTSFTIQSEGLMAYEIWAGMLIFNIVVVSINIRILIISDQLSPILLITCFAGIISYYLVFLFVEVILYSDVKDTLINQFGNGQFWMLLIFFCVLIEGYEWTYRKYTSAKE